MKTVNLNDCIRVRLTIEGRNAYHDYWSNLVRYCGSLKEPALLDEDIWEGQLHDFMTIFGSRIQCGYPLTVTTDLTVISES